MQLGKKCYYLGFNDTLLRIIGIPVIGFFFPILFFEYQLDYGILQYLPKWFISTLFTTGYWEGTRMLTIFFRKRYPLFKDTRKRLLLQIPSILLFAFLAIDTLFFYIVCQPILRYFDMPPPPPGGLIAGYLIILMFIAIYESIYFYHQLRISILEAEQAKQDHIRSQLEGLRNQVNPHFLFNSLNTLMDLVTENPTIAVNFLKRLSHVYRYILEIREHPTVTVAEELEFIKSYVFLQEERFKGNLKVCIEIPETYYQHQVLPLSLQILFENAIKHNIISSKKALIITVSVVGDKIVVKNNLQRKNQVVDSTKVGLENVRSRYRLISNSQVDVLEDKEYFIVGLPLIAPYFSI